MSEPWKTEKSIIQFCSAWILTVWSTVFSYRENPLYDDTYVDGVFKTDYADPRTFVGSGGFPLEVYNYPRPPMGPGPEQSEIPLFMNFVFWFAVVWLLSRCFKRSVDVKMLTGVSLILAVVSTLFWFGYMAIKFD